MKHIVIIGNGIAGITAARHIRKQTDFKITVISAETKYFWSRTALMYVYMGHMKFEHTQPYEKHFWKKNRINLIHDHVENIDPRKHSLTLKAGNNLTYDQLILATGSKPATYGWGGLKLKGVSGMVSYQDLQYIEKATRNIKKAVVVGGGLIGIELTEMLRSRQIEVTLLVREKYFLGNILLQQEAEMIGRHIMEHGVGLQLSTELAEIKGDENGKVNAIKTTSGDSIDCEFVGLATGVKPNIRLAQSAGIECNKGILVDDTLKTSVEDIYAIGDCAEQRQPLNNRKSIEAVWYTARMMGETVAMTISGKPTPYQPGNWFNSAKFFDIEYQTYGVMPHQLNSRQNEFYWEHTSGRKCIHFVYAKNTNILLGVNTFGIRLKHEVFDQWLNEERPITSVLENLRSANFDPEFFKPHEEGIIKAWNDQHPDDKVTLKEKRSLIERIFG